MTPIALRFRETFESLRSRNFRLFFLGQLVSVTGTWVQQVAAAWLVLRLTSSGVMLGIDTGLTFLPMLLFGFWGGALADRRDKRQILVVTNTAYGVLALVLWALVATDTVQLWMVFVLSFLSGTVAAIDAPTRQSFYAEMVHDDHIVNAVSLNSAVMTGTRIIGPAIAAALIASFGLEWCFLVNGVSYIAAIIGLGRMRVDELNRQHRAGQRTRLRETLAYVRSDEALWLPLVLMGVLFLFTFNFSVTVPLLAERTFAGGIGTFGTFLAVLGAGSFIGALGMARVTGPNIRRLSWFAIAVGVASVLVGASPTRPVVVVALGVLGFAMMVFMITGNSGLQLATRPEMRGRVMAIYSIVFLGGTPIGAPLTGLVAEHIGPRAAMAGAGAIAVVAGAVTLRYLRRRAIVEDTGEIEGAGEAFSTVEA